MWAFAVECLHLRTEEFWMLSPREFFKLADVYERNEKMLNYRAGLVAAVTRNVHRQKDADRVWQPLDFFGALDEEQQIATADEILDKMENFERLVKG
jgi:hypothetical protein